MIKDLKAYFLMRKDIEMSKGKFGVQVGHGTDFIHMQCEENVKIDWMVNNRKKIILEVKTLEKLVDISDKLIEESIGYNFIVDSGLTEFGQQTTTGIVIYPIEYGSLPKRVQKLQCWKGLV
jgi:PTH2 family peptidyl-tRNA hydrolase